MGSQRFKEVEKLLKLLKRNPHSKVFAPLAELYRKNGLVDDALSLCERGLSFHPDYVAGKLAYAHALLDANQVQRAAIELEDVVFQNPESLLAHRLLLVCYEKMNMGGKVKEIQEVIQRLYPYSKTQKGVDQPHITNKGAVESYEIKSLKNIFGSENEWGEEMIERKKEKKKYYTLSLAELYEHQGHLQKALEVYESLSELYPERKDLLDKKISLEKQVRNQEIPEKAGTSGTSNDSSTSSQISLLEELLESVQDSRKV